MTPKINQPFGGYQTFSTEMLQTIMVAKNKKLFSCLRYLLMEFHCCVLLTYFCRNYHPNAKELLQELSISVNRQIKDISPDEFLQIISECYKICDLPNEHEL